MNFRIQHEAKARGPLLGEDEKDVGERGRCVTIQAPGPAESGRPTLQDASKQLVASGMFGSVW